MFNNPYETTVLSAVPIKAIVEQLKVAAAHKLLEPVELANGNVIPGLYSVPATEKDIKPFNHPITFESFGVHYTVIDTRPFQSIDRVGGVRTTNPTEYNLAVIRGALTRYWSADRAEDFLTMGDLPAKVFTNLISQTIIRRFGLSGADAQRLIAVSALYYFSLFRDLPVGDDESAKIRMVRRLSRVTPLDPKVISDVVDLNLKLGNLNAFCDAVRMAVPSPRLEQFNPGLFAGMIGGMWFGAAAREIVIASFEYPPYFIALCYIAATERGLNRPYLGKEVQEVGKRNGLGDAFVKGVANFLEDVTHG